LAVPKIFIFNTALALLIIGPLPSTIIIVKSWSVAEFINPVM